jgi:hypothetical protein
MGPDHPGCSFQGSDANQINTLQAEIQKLREALTDLYELLEQYAPAWYTEDHRNKARAALYPTKP